MNKVRLVKNIGKEDGAGKTVLEGKQKLLLYSVMKGADQFITVFSAHVDVSGIIESLKGKSPPVPRENESQEQHEGPTSKQAKSDQDETEMDSGGQTSSKEQGEAKVDNKPTSNQKPPKAVTNRDTLASTSTSKKRTIRGEEIEQDAKMSGAKGTTGLLAQYNTIASFSLFRNSETTPPSSKKEVDNIRY